MNQRTKRRRLKRQIDAYFDDVSDIDSQEEEAIGNEIVEDNYREIGELQTSPFNSTLDIINSDSESENNNSTLDNDNSSNQSSSFDTSFDILSSDSEDEITEHDKPSLSQNLAKHATKHGLGRDAVNELLLILREQGLDLPKDSRTLLKTPRHVEVLSQEKWSYHYIGIQKALNSLKMQFQDLIKLTVNIDGLPVFKSTNSQLWPILGSVFGSKIVFPIAFFYSDGKPENVDFYLKDFIDEVSNLASNGVLIGTKKFEFTLKVIVCDAPARSFLKCIIGHTGYYSCERCSVKGESKDHRIVFNGDCSTETARTKEEFNNFSYKRRHQKALSPFVKIDFNCVNDFPLDYMHCVLLGVVKRILVFISKGPKICKLSVQQTQQISDRLLKIKLPSNFNRQPRSIKDLCYWKATEYRSFLMYHGPIVLKGIVSDATYKHFIALHVGISLLLNEDKVLDSSALSYARNLLCWFSENAKKVYGDTFAVYNVHALRHLADDVVYHRSSLNEISAFKFENYMQQLKKMVKNCNNPVSQLVKRTTENKFNQESSSTTESSLEFKDNGRDIFFKGHNGNFCKIKTFISNEKYECYVVKANTLENFYPDEIDSRKIGIFYLRNENNPTIKVKIMHITDIAEKIVGLPYKNGIVYFPLLHKGVIRLL